ncbi:DUF371 domain-containing protein [Haloparvum sp. PAK95]|uniref:DUF371 domain-containing protein n=1 Tax=Haloparvum sp. PAK95 TaxID=3418962 RepID=UPI003D2EB941
MSDLSETIHATGHENVRAEHGSTFEVTTDDWLTPAGDCILAVEADRTPADFAPAFVQACRDSDATITAELVVGDGDDDGDAADEDERHEATIVGSGHPDLAFNNDRSAVGRTSEYVDDRTIMVKADAAAADLDRDLVDALAAGADLELTLRVD